MRMLLAVASLVVLTACDAEVRAPVQGEEKVTLAANADGRVSFDLPFAKGDIKLPAGLMENSNFDIDGVKMIPGGQMTGFNLNAGEGKQARINMTFSAPASPDEVKRYFIDQFKAQSIEAAMTADAIKGTTNDGSDFVMRFAPQGTGTNGTIEIVTNS